MMTSTACPSTMRWNQEGTSRECSNRLCIGPFGVLGVVYLGSGLHSPWRLQRRSTESQNINMLLE